MQKRNRPAVDKAIASAYGVSRDGQPLSYNRAPAPDLEPWIGRLYATVVDAPDDYRLECGLLSDTSFHRFQLKGQWTAQTADGPKVFGRAALFFGPQTKLMPITVTGSFISVGISLRPGTGYALRRMKTSDFTDRLAAWDDVGLPGEATLNLLEQTDDPEQWLQIMEDAMRQVVANSRGEVPDPISTRFENVAFVNPAISVAEFAQECGVDKRTVERIVTRDFGMPPKKVLRRARALDMASHLRGVADHEEAEELALRYYDQSHLIREFVELFGLSPSQFVARPQPLFTLALESRQARRLEAIERLSPGARRPWE